MMNKNGSILWVAPILLAVLTLAGCLPIGLRRGPTVSPPVGPRLIAENTLGLREYWRRSVECLGTRNLVAASGRVACVSYREGPGGTVLVFDAANGSLLWEAHQEYNAFLVADAERLYLVQVYDIYAYAWDGRWLWHTGLFPDKICSVELSRDRLYVMECIRGWWRKTIDVHTGDILSRESLLRDDGFALFAQYPQFDLYIQDVPSMGTPWATLWAVDRTTRQTRWVITGRTLLMPSGPPLLVDNLLLVNVWREVVALDASSGQVVWRTYNPAAPKTVLVTEAILMADSLYAVCDDGRLIRLDVRTGQETGYIQFAPPLSNHNPYGGSNFLGWASDGQMLFVSFEDSQELIALGP
ncbi:MAG: PQQ-binding-like beta-propeller repeat protein [Thermoflexales bacterium]|nr:PQQ-binding-like beta-propeller repeat protein [Thermoflexales bacterium]